VGLTFIFLCIPAACPELVTKSGVSSSAVQTKTREKSSEGAYPVDWEPGIPQAMQQHGGRNRVLLRRRCELELPVVSAADASIALAPADPAADERRQAAVSVE
jgi:hypothetical protein